MLGRRRALTWALGAGIAAASMGSNAKGAGRHAVSPPLQTWGYFPVWMQSRWQRVQLPVWNRVVLFELPVLPTGAIAMPPNWYAQWHAMRAAIARAGSSLDLAFTLMEAGKFERLFSHPAAIVQLLETIATAAGDTGIGGVHLDFEVYGAVSPRAIAGCRRFIALLSERLQRQSGGRTVLSIFFPMGTEHALFDAATLRLVDYIVVQGYDAHWAESPHAGSVAPLRGAHALTWEKSLAHVLRLGLSRHQILFSIPYFGYEWPVKSAQPGAETTGRGEIITYAPIEASVLPEIRVSVLDRIAHYPVRRDPDSGSPYYVYQSPAGRFHQGWFEDAISLAEKWDFIRRERLCGIAAFPLGYDDGRFDALMQTQSGAR